MFPAQLSGPHRSHAFHTGAQRWNRGHSRILSASTLRLQGGPDSTDVKNDPFYNQWEDLDDSPIGWHITEPVDPCSTEPWLSAVGGGIY